MNRLFLCANLYIVTITSHSAPNSKKTFDKSVVISKTVLELEKVDEKTKMNYQEAKEKSNELEKIYADAKIQLKMISGVKSSIGLTSDSVKQSEPYKIAKANLDTAFRNIQTFNVLFVKQFKAEIRAERNKKKLLINR